MKSDDSLFYKRMVLFVYRVTEKNYHKFIQDAYFYIKDVRAHCYCASLVRTLFIGHARAMSFSSARTESKT